MTTLYFDSSYLFRIYSTERGHEAVKALLPRAGVIASAWHARAEIAAILHRKKREGALADAAIHALRRQFLAECEAGHISLLPLTEAVLVRLEAVLFAAPANAFLRTGDALHLACAAEHGFAEVYSNDRQFLAAADLFGLRGVDVIPR